MNRLNFEGQSRVGFARKFKIDGQPAAAQNRAHVQVRLPMPLDHPLMHHPQIAQPLQDRGFARHRHPVHPFTVYPQLGAGRAPFYLPKAQNASKESKTAVQHFVYLVVGLHNLGDPDEYYLDHVQRIR